MHIPFVDLNVQYRANKQDIDNAITTVLLHGKFIQGPEVQAFERAFARFTRSAYCVSLNSGTDALLFALRALHLQKGDEVIVPANTFIATALAVSENGLTPVFVDMDQQDFGIDISDLQKKLTRRTKAVIVVHLFGQADKLRDIQAVIKRMGRPIHLVEDACQAHGAMYEGRPLGSFGICAAYSFYPGKNLGAYGDGGAVTTNNRQLAKKISLLREYGQTKKYVHGSLGRNSRLDTLQASILRAKLPKLLEWNENRRQAAKQYTELFRRFVPEVIPPPWFPERPSIFHLYVLRTPKRNQLLKYLQEKGVSALIHYPTPLHLQKAYRYLGYKKGDLPNAEFAAAHMLSLPLFPEITPRQIRFVVQTIGSFFHN